MTKINVGILGATGMVGIQYAALLANHPRFQLTFLAASERSAGKRYAELLGARWHHPFPPPDQIVHHIDQIDQAKKSCSLLFSALSNESARVWESEYAKNGFGIISNASCHRSSPDIPMIIPEINHDHLKVLSLQQSLRNWEGFIVVKSNCTLQSYMIPLAPLHDAFTVTKLHLSTLQAVSGAGYPGLSSWDMLDNVIPYIAGEEEKSESEPLKIWGTLTPGGIQPSQEITISSHCNRVPVSDGHLACVSVAFKKRPTQEQILEAWREFTPLPQQLSLPSAPNPLILYREEPDRPQPRLDRLAGSGMSITVGRLRPCPLLDYRFSALSHNTIRGAAGGAILCAELLLSQGIIPSLLPALRS